MKPSDLHPPLEETARRLVRSAGAATVSQVWRLVVTFVTHMALRRLIPPEEFGPWYWVEPVFIILAQIRDLGVPGHVVRDPEKPYGNFLRLQVVWGAILTASIFVAAPYLAAFYTDATAPMTEMIRAMCVFLLVQGLGAVPMIYFEAELLVERTIPAELARNAVFAALSLYLAWHGHGVWSVVIGHVVAGAVFSAMLWISLWRRSRRRSRSRSQDEDDGEMGLAWRPGVTRRLVLLSLPLMALSILELAVGKLDSFVLALRYPNEVIGVVGLAMYAVYFFSRLLADPVGRALYPALVRYGDQPARAFDAFRVATVFMASFVAPLAFFLFVNAEAVALFLGGKKWIGAAEYLRFLSLVPLVRPLSMFGLEMLLTRHMDRLLLLYTSTNLIVLSALGWWLTSGPLGANGMAIAGYFPAGLLFLAWGIHRLSPTGLRLLLVQLLELYAVSAALFLAVFYFAPEGLWLRFALSCVVGCAAVGFALFRHGASTMRFLRAQ